MFRFACSVVLRGGRGTAEKCHWHVWGAFAMFQPHWVCPYSRCVYFPCLHCSGSRLLYIKRALHCVRFQFSGTPQKRGLGWPCVLCLPGPSSSGCQELDRRTLPGCGAPHHPAVPASVSMRAGRVRVPCVCSGELVSSRDPPGGCQPSRISGGLWLETGSLFAVW